MANTTGQTREEIRVFIGRMMRAVKLIEADASGTTTTIVVDELAIGQTDDFNGMWLVFTSGQSNIDSEIRQVVDSSVASNQVTLTFFPAVSNAPVDGATAELWDRAFDPNHIHSLMNQAVIDATNYVYTSTTDDTLHTGGRRRWDIPLTFENLTDIYLRVREDFTEIIGGGTVWDESIDSDFTVTQDGEDLLFNETATKFVIGSGVSAGDIATHAIGSTDLSSETHIEFGIKVRDAVASDDFRIRLSATVNGGSTTEEIIIPAISAITDTWVRVAMTAPSAATAIISVALEMNANQGANIVWLTTIDGTRNDDKAWVLVPRHLWWIDKASRDLVFHPAYNPGYRLMRLVGGDNPIIFVDDTTTNEVPDDYIIYRTAGMLLLPDPDERARAGIYLGMAETAKGKFPVLVNKRDCQ